MNIIIIISYLLNVYIFNSTTSLGTNFHSDFRRVTFLELKKMTSAMICNKKHIPSRNLIKNITFLISNIIKIYC